MMQLSYVHGASVAPFIGDTIGVYFDRIVERFAEGDALIVRRIASRHSLKSCSSMTR
jgi:hypothetical protein